MYDHRLKMISIQMISILELMSIHRRRSTRNKPESMLWSLLNHFPVFICSLGLSGKKWLTYKKEQVDWLVFSVNCFYHTRVISHLQTMFNWSIFSNSLCNRSFTYLKVKLAKLSNVANMIATSNRNIKKRAWSARK